MKISKYISLLEKIKEEEGDLDCIVEKSENYFISTGFSPVFGYTNDDEYSRGIIEGVIYGEPEDFEKEYYNKKIIQIVN